MLELTLDKVVGASGSVGGIGIEAPFPSEDVTESPSVLNAVTWAYTESRLLRLKSPVRKVETGMVHVLAEMMVELFSASQSVKSFSKVLVDVLISSL